MNLLQTVKTAIAEILTTIIILTIIISIKTIMGTTDGNMKTEIITIIEIIKSSK